MGKLPENLSSLTELRISATPLFEEAQLLRSQFEGMKQIVKLVINNCNSLTSLPFSILPSSLKRITIYHCQRLKLEEPVGYCNMFLEQLRLDECDSIDDISPEFLPRARKLSISICQNVTRFLIPTATESLCILSCTNLEILSVAVESAMTSLDISYCEKLKCLPEIELFNLQVLKISHCKKLVNGRKEWCLQRLPCLTELVIKHDGSDEDIQHWELPSSIKRLTVRNLKTLSSQVLKSLTSLQYLFIADPLFLKLVQLSLSNCKDCDSLPALGQLPSLKFLYIRGMHGITEVTQEFYGSSSSKKPFNSLEELEFADMPEWKQWHVLGSGEFPLLEYLSIENCPKLMGKLPENLCSLTELRISETPLFEEAQLFRSQFEGMKQIVELFIVNYLTSLPFSILPSSLKRITISDCQKLKLEEPVGYCNMFFEELTLRNCDCIDELLPRARKLSISSCQNVTRFLIPTATESLTIWGCENLEILSVAVESAMTSLHILYCGKLKCLPEIELFKLQVLEIVNCKKLGNGRKEWCLQRLPCLTELVIEHDGSDEEIQHWELPSSIKRLKVFNLKTLSSQVLKSLTSLQYLHIANLPQIQSLLEEGGLPSSLSELILWNHDELHSLHLCHLTSLLCLHFLNCPNLQSLTESTLPSSLSELTITDCHNLQSLSDSTLPSSLSQLTIHNCRELQSVSEFALPSSLSELIIMDCRNLQSLPVKGMPSSLSILSIFHCPLLTPLLEFDKGKYWPNIAQIPIIFISGKCM